MECILGEISLIFWVLTAREGDYGNYGNNKNYGSDGTAATLHCSYCSHYSHYAHLSSQLPQAFDVAGGFVEPQGVPAGGEGAADVGVGIVAHHEAVAGGAGRPGV